MGRILAGGKLPVDVLREVVADAAIGAPEVLLGPAIGEDAAAIRIEAGVLVAATDPITLTGSEVGSYAVVINANDVAVTGVRPRWFLATVLLPVGSTEDEVRALFTELRGTLDDVGAVLVGGHTEVTDAVERPVVVGQMLGHGPEDDLVRTSGAEVGDVVLQVGAVPVEGAAVLAVDAADRLIDVDDEVLDAARSATSDPGISVVEAALAAGAQGATAMHDPTEGGLAAGLHELAAASGCGVEVDRDAVIWFEPGRIVCAALDADPWATLASGCLIATFRVADAETAGEVLRGTGLAVRPIGRMTGGSGVAFNDGSPLRWPERDEVARLRG